MSAVRLSVYLVKRVSASSASSAYKMELESIFLGSHVPRPTRLPGPHPPAPPVIYVFSDKTLALADNKKKLKGKEEKGLAASI